MRFLLPILGLGMAFALSHCGKGDETTARLKVASLSTKSARAGVATLVPSSTDYSFANVDGIKVKLKSVRGQDAGADSFSVDIPINKTLEFTGDANQQVALDQDVTWKAGSFRGISLIFENAWEVKAYCKTDKNVGQGKMVYTTATGVKKLDCTRVDCTTLPSDYGYSKYDFLSTYSGYVSSKEYNQDTHYKFTVAKDDKPNISLLFDGSFNVVCWNGGTWDQNKALGAFRGPQTDAERKTFWPDAAPAMATSYLPIFGYLTNDAAEGLPTARTFISSHTDGTTNDAQAQLKLDSTDANFTFKAVEVATIVYKADGTALTGSARNISAFDVDQPLDLDLEGFTASARAGSDFFASGWYWAGGNSEPKFIRNRQFTAHNPPATAGTTFMTVVKDGPDCGQTLTDFQSNNPSRACLGASVTRNVYWKEMPRN